MIVLLFQNTIRLVKTTKIIHVWNLISSGISVNFSKLKCGDQQLQTKRKDWINKKNREHPILILFLKFLSRWNPWKTCPLLRWYYHQKFGTDWFGTSPICSGRMWSEHLPRSLYASTLMHPKRKTPRHLRSSQLCSSLGTLLRFLKKKVINS